MESFGRGPFACFNISSYFSPCVRAKLKAIRHARRDSQTFVNRIHTIIITCSGEWKRLFIIGQGRPTFRPTVRTRFGTSVHPNSVIRAPEEKEKKTRAVKNGVCLTACTLRVIRVHSYRAPRGLQDSYVHRFPRS